MQSSSFVNNLGNRIRDALPSTRLVSIDFTRGLVMILMALDHASFINPYHVGGEGFFGNRPEYPDIITFLTRFVTHFCAPAFLFLAGTAITLSTVRHQEKGETQKAISQHLIIRGLILLLIEWILISTLFNISFGAVQLYFGILACIGIGMILFAFAHRLPSSVLIIFSVGIILLSPFLMMLQSSAPIIDFETETNEIVRFLAVALFLPMQFEGKLYGIYPLIPWLGVMGLGVVFGRWLIQQQEISSSDRKIAERLGIVGGLCLVIFFILRFASLFGVPTWPMNYLAPESLALDSFFLIAKYPPSIVFLLWSLGGTLIFLALGFLFQDNSRFRSLMTPVLLFGATALFFYCVHMTLFVSGFIFVRTVIPTYDPGVLEALIVSLIWWIIVLLVLIPICLWFRGMKSRYPTSVLKYI
ncbi:MAG: DUF1624 domain-containing protein [Candidatus Hodarchaeota archaeon]